MRALLVYKKSQLQLYSIDRKNPELLALQKSHDPLFLAMQQSHDTHLSAIESCARTLRKAGYKVQRSYRARLGSARLGDFSNFDLIVSVGGDGTMLDLSHHLRGKIPIIGVNSDPERSVGMLAACDATKFAATLNEIAAGQLKPRALTRIALWLNGQSWPQLALNDVLISHKMPAATSRYDIRIGEHTERHTCSGLWISTAMGSSGAMRAAGGEICSVDDEHLQFRVREPNPSRGDILLRTGFFKKRQPLHVRSLMREGQIFIDGPHLKIPFAMGSRLDIEPLPNSFHLFLPESRLRRRSSL